MKFLITGITGQVGYDIKLELEKRGYTDIVAPSYKEMDITNKEQVQNIILTYKPNIIFHCAAYTAVDKAEIEKDICFNINVNGTKYIAKCAEQVGAKMIYFSSDYVFDGKKAGEYFPDDLVNPVNYYGFTKELGEGEVRFYDNNLIIRTSWVFGLHGNNFVKTMIRLGKSRDLLTVIQDQIGSPTYSKDLAELVVYMALKDKQGTYHVTNEGTCSWYDFAKKILELSNISTEVKPITTLEYNAPAKRPLNSKLNKDKLLDEGLYKLPSWEDALIRFIAELNKQEMEKSI